MSTEYSNATLLEIAQRVLGLETRNRDCLDFREQAVWSIRKALQEAFIAGVTADSRQEPSWPRPPSVLWMWKP